MAQVIAENLEWQHRDSTDRPDDLGSFVRWCRECGVPVLRESNCPACDSPLMRCARDLKPVFGPERERFEKLLHRRLPVFLFTNRNLVYFNGRFLFSFAVDPAEGLRVISDRSHNLDGVDPVVYDMQHSASQWALCLRANLPALQQMEEEAVAFIRDVAARYPDRRPIIAFSGGKDSAVVALLVQKALGAIPLLFGDTTLEFPDTYAYIERFADLYGFELFRERPELDFFDLCRVLEPPSRIMRWCCTVCKSRPINTFYSGYADRVLSFDGIRRMESSVRADYPRVAHIQKFSRQVVARPILGWSSFAVWLYLFGHGTEYNPLYEYGYGRVGCMYCPNNTTYNDYLTGEHFPHAHDRWQRHLVEYATRAGKADPQGYVVGGFWKVRSIGKERTFVVERSNPCEQEREVVYTFQQPVQGELIEFLKPLGKVSIVGPTETASFIVGSANPFVASGAVGQTELSVTFSSRHGRLTRLRLEKQIEKYLNCVHCGGCVGVCSRGAISIRDASYFVDESLCTRCGRCTTTKYLKEGCIALNFGARKRAIRRD